MFKTKKRARIVFILGVTALTYLDSIENRETFEIMWKKKGP